jgi:hypothetical protein
MAAGTCTWVKQERKLQAKISLIESPVRDEVQKASEAEEGDPHSANSQDKRTTLICCYFAK